MTFVYAVVYADGECAYDLALYNNEDDANKLFNKLNVKYGKYFKYLEVKKYPLCGINKHNLRMFLMDMNFRKNLK